MECVIVCAKKKEKQNKWMCVTEAQTIQYLIAVCLHKKKNRGELNMDTKPRKRLGWF